MTAPPPSREPPAPAPEVAGRRTGAGRSRVERARHAAAAGEARPRRCRASSSRAPSRPNRRTADGEAAPAASAQAGRRDQSAGAYGRVVRIGTFYSRAQAKQGWRGIVAHLSGDGAASRGGRRPSRRCATAGPITGCSSGTDVAGASAKCCASGCGSSAQSCVVVGLPPGKGRGDERQPLRLMTTPAAVARGGRRRGRAARRVGRKMLAALLVVLVAAAIVAGDLFLARPRRTRSASARRS